MSLKLLYVRINHNGILEPMRQISKLNLCKLQLIFCAALFLIFFSQTPKTGGEIYWSILSFVQGKIWKERNRGWEIVKALKEEKERPERCFEIRKPCISKQKKKKWKKVFKNSCWILLTFIKHTFGIFRSGARSFFS